MANSKGTAYAFPIEEGKVRIVLNVESLNTKITDLTKKTIDGPIDDSPMLKFDFSKVGIEPLGSLEKELTFGAGRKEGELVLEENSVWFDLEIDAVSNLLNRDIKFNVVSSSGQYVYFIEKLHYQIEWLQNDNVNQKVFRVSITNKTYQQSVDIENLNFKINEIEQAASLLGRAVRKIDLRVGSAFVKLNTNDGRLDPVLSVIASKLGYSIQPINEEVRKELADKGKKATHKISLIMNY